MSADGQWVSCVVDSDYEICNQYPYQIRRKSNKKIIKEHLNCDYIKCYLNKKLYLKHRIIALQFIPNDDPDNKLEIDHINHIRSDNRLINLRWVSSSDNNKNKSSHKGYEYVDDIDDDCILVDVYGKYSFENYYYNDKEDVFYYYNGINYRKLKINYTKYNKAFVYARDINNKQVKVYYSIFIKQYNLI